MAEAILKRLVADRPDADQWKVASAGIWAVNGSPAAALSQLVLQQMGLDIHSHQSQPVTNDLLQNYDLILTMESHHKEGLTVQFEQYADRIFMLSEMIGRVEDIPDPIGGEVADYEDTAHLLEKILTEGLDRIAQLANVHPKKPGKISQV